MHHSFEEFAVLWEHKWLQGRVNYTVERPETEHETLTFDCAGGRLDILHSPCRGCLWSCNFADDVNWRQILLVLVIRVQDFDAVGNRRFFLKNDRLRSSTLTLRRQDRVCNSLAISRSVYRDFKSIQHTERGRAPASLSKNRSRHFYVADAPINTIPKSDRQLQPEQQSS
jgi:hypothetical protein